MCRPQVAHHLGAAMWAAVLGMALGPCCCSGHGTGFPEAIQVGSRSAAGSWEGERNQGQDMAPKGSPSGSLPPLLTGLVTTRQSLQITNPLWVSH